MNEPVISKKKETTPTELVLFYYKGKTITRQELFLSVIYPTKL